MQMTDEQRQLAEDNINLVHRFMIDYHLNPDVYYDLLMIELCRAAMVYDKNSGNTFSTLAYSYFLNLVKNVIKKNKSEKNGGTIKIISMDKMIDDEHTIYEIIPDLSMTPEEIIMDSVFKNDIYECCINKHDKMVVDMILLDYSQVEIADYLSISRQRVNRILKDIGRRYTERRE